MEYGDKIARTDCELLDKSALSDLLTWGFGFIFQGQIHSFKSGCGCVLNSLENKTGKQALKIFPLDEIDFTIIHFFKNKKMRSVKNTFNK